MSVEDDVILIGLSICADGGEVAADVIESGFARTVEKNITNLNTESSDGAGVGCMDSFCDGVLCEVLKSVSALSWENEC